MDNDMELTSQKAAPISVGFLGKGLACIEDERHDYDGEDFHKKCFHECLIAAALTILQAGGRKASRGSGRNGC
jgi:hypothetical protein